MSNTHKNLTELFTDCANTLRKKLNTTSLIIADDIPNKIDELLKPQGQISIEENGTFDISTVATANVNIPSGAIIIPASSTTTSTLTFTNSSTYQNFSILFFADVGYAAASQVYGIYTYSHHDSYYRAVYYMSYGSSKFNFTKNSKPDEVTRSGDNFSISSVYSGIGLTWITNLNQGKYIGFFW